MINQMKVFIISRQVAFSLGLGALILLCVGEVVLRAREYRRELRRERRRRKEREARARSRVFKYRAIGW